MYLCTSQVMIPLSLYVTIEVIKLGQVYFITNDLDLYHAPTDSRVQCRALNITEDLGQVEVVFSDKTGTLTENQMVFKRCTIGGVDYSETTGSTLEFMAHLQAWIKRHLSVSLHVCSQRWICQCYVTQF